MKRHIYFILTLSVCYACTTKQDSTDKQHVNSVTPIDSFFVPVDTADEMTSSYIASLGGDADTDLNYWTVDADALRDYLTNTDIKKMKISLAHTTEYINNGNYGVPAGYSPAALTIIMTGVNNDGGTVNYNSTWAMDRAKPCPPVCLIEVASKH
ncbi:hypothetical protein [Pedobacter insulae]|uniref:Uncharacterized protein n=1 Tax=Pedobacter insulae TaxID=414048 RepID=A0A1I2ZIZ6_9SPHI|nr:hypothetical protein [Pedobacter insulae]SFH37783.1 hypothetical protein SAMN04489864_11064 [Pedobacter insulae]